MQQPHHHLVSYNYSSKQLNLLTICLTCAVFLLLPLVTFQQTCQSLYIDEKESTTNVACPISFINDGNGCQPFQTVYDKIMNTNCSKDSDCKFGYMKCVYNKCYSADRVEGDSCSQHEQCVTTKASVKKGGLYCKDSKCKPYKVKFTKKIGEKCGDVDNNEGLYYSCEFGASCVLGSCLKTPMVSKDENCTRVFNPFKEYRVCQASFYCGEDSICINSIRLEAKCNETSSCQTGYSCRKSKDSNDAICQRFADFGDYCREDSDCGNTNSGLVTCSNNKCKRLLAGLKGSTCQNNTECYSGYCNKDTKTCQDVTLDNGDTCYNSTSCNSLSGGCVCGGKASNGNNKGKCLPSCAGPLYDVISCLYNKGLYIGTPLASSLTPGLGYAQYVDEDSSIYRSCKRYYERYYTCQHRVWKNVGQSSTINSMNGFKISTESSFENIDVLLPRRSDANGQTTFSFKLLLVSLFAIIVILF
ncbi:predicted protein [Naegleria gruberi]|uniref:Predicted protein n=1 Tax=Naegleria gruberi TaxID=5762 RepID=D2VBN5_NAEGR|nr:uncharacterized protein NAEGRDRAFT_48244 [Naegleria gruberi]EFC45938.1 predicted protein [Naegleria gruberi]|eukprot:XP_002678682.1 predicted protein [Naegleria gruberi strain NEG-M]